MWTVVVAVSPSAAAMCSPTVLVGAAAVGSVTGPGQGMMPGKGTSKSPKSSLALSRWKMLTGTAMFINRLGKT